MKLPGIFVDTATPFDHAGALYRVKIEHNIAKWNQTSVSGYVIGGQTGEGALLSPEEKCDLWRIAAAAAPDKILIAGIQAQGVHDAVAQIDRAATLGYAAALVDTHHEKDREVFFYRTLADRARIPLVSPGFCRSESALWSSLADGATGAVLGIANAAPYACIAVWEAHRTREDEAGQDWQSRITPAADLINKLGIPALKHAMDLNGYYGGPPRLPWTTPTPAEQKQIEQAFDNLKS